MFILKKFRILCILLLHLYDNKVKLKHFIYIKKKDKTILNSYSLYVPTLVSGQNFLTFINT